jgi:hypothetical protein
MTLDPSYDASLPPPPPPPPPPSDGGSHKKLWWAVGGVAILAAAGGGIAAWLLTRDGGSAAGGGPAPVAVSAQSVPADARAYASIDLTSLPDAARLMAALGTPDEQALTEGMDDGLGTDLGEGLGIGEGLSGAVAEAGQLEGRLTCVADGLGFDAEDLPAWVGDEAGLALLDMQIDAASGEIGDLRALMVVSVADQAGAEAEAYLPQLTAAIGTCVEATFTQAAYNGVTVYSVTPAEGQPISVALVEDQMMLGIGAGTLEDAIDLADSGALSNDPGFAEVMAAMPADRDVSIYVGGNLLQEAMESANAAAGQAGQSVTLPESCGASPAAAPLGLGMSMTLLDGGVRMDAVSLGSADAPAPALVPSGIPALLPADTLMYAGTSPFDMASGWTCLKDVMAQMPAEEGQPSIEDSLNMVGFMLGIDLEEDLIGQLTGEMGLALLPATSGPLAEGSGVNLGILAVMGVEDPGAMAGTVDAMAEGIARMSEAPASPRPFDGGTLYAISDGESDMMLFGMAGDHMVLTTDESHAAALLAGGPKLTGSTRWAQAFAGLPAGSQPIMFLDMAGLLAALPQELTGDTQMPPIDTVAAGALQSGNAMRLTMYAVVDY